DVGALHPCRRLRLLWTQRRGRRRARRGAARARYRRPAGQAAMDARRRVHVGALRLGDGDEARRHAGPRRQRGRLVARSLEPSAQRAGWMPGRKGSADSGWGFAYARYKNLACYCAVAAEVAVDRKTGQVRVKRAVSGVDVGQVVNPDGVTNQIEGGVIQSTSW